MGKLRQIHEKISQLRLMQKSLDIVDQSDREIGELNAKQMQSGKDAQGDKIEPPYSALTVRIKKAKGQPHDRVTLRDTGAFQSSIDVSVNGTRFSITSKDSKTPKLEKKYGKEIFGLGAEAKKQYVNETFFPALRKHIEATLGITMKNK